MPSLKVHGLAVKIDTCALLVSATFQSPHFFLLFACDFSAASVSFLPSHCSEPQPRKAQIFYFLFRLNADGRVFLRNFCIPKQRDETDERKDTPFQTQLS